MSLKKEDKPEELKGADFVALGEAIITSSVPQITDKAQLVDLFKSIFAPMGEALAKSEEALKSAREARPVRTPRVK